MRWLHISAQKVCALTISILALVLMLLSASVDGADDDFGGVLKVIRPTTPPVMDGLLDMCYREGDSVTQFVQQMPNEGQPLSEPTKAFVIEDDRNLYVAVVCKTPGRMPDCRPSSRDGRGGDEICLYLDTFHDLRTAYRFTVNAANVQSDAVISANGLEENFSWDGVFESHVYVDSGVYVVEMAIPWTTLRFDPSQTTWGFNLSRSIPIDGEIGYVVPIRQNEGLRVSEFALLEGVSPKLSGLGLQVNPNGFSRQEKSYDERSDVFELGADINWTISPAVRLQTTINPDFAQVEADPFALNLSKYETYFSEKRPFFVEGDEYFQPTGGMFANTLNLLYSRKIGRRLDDGTDVPLEAGARVIGKTGRVEMGALLARTGKVGYEGWFGPETEPDAVFLADRVGLQIGSIVTAGAMYAGKYTDDYDNDVVSVDGTVATSTFQLTGQVAQSRFEHTTDIAAISTLSWTPRYIQTGFDATVIGDDFDVSEIGFVPWAGLRSYSVYAGPTVFPSTGVMTYGYAVVHVTSQREFGEEDFSNTIQLDIGGSLRNNWGVMFSLGRGKVYELDTHFDPKSVSYYLSSDVSRRMWFQISGMSERSYNYLRMYVARNSSLDWLMQLQPMKRLYMSFNGDAWVEQKPSGDIEEITWRLRPGIAWLISNAMSLRVYEEMTVYRSSGLSSVRLGVMYKYNFLPKSWVYVAFNDRQRREDDGTYTPLQQVFVVKLTYLLGL